jgi:hypothetical protein
MLQNVLTISNCLTSQLRQLSYFPARCFDYAWTHDACRILQNEEHASSNYCTRRLSNKTSLDVGLPFNMSLCALMLLWVLLPRYFMWCLDVFGVDEVGGVSVCQDQQIIHTACCCNPWWLPSFDHIRIYSIAKGFDHKLRAVASVCQPFDP